VKYAGCQGPQYILRLVDEVQSAGGRDIVPSLFEEKSALFVFVATGSGVGYVSGVAILCFTVQVAQAPRTAFGGYFGALKI
jgi:hypothetical protein